MPKIFEFFDKGIDYALDEGARLILVERETVEQLLLEAPVLLDDSPNDLDIDPTVLDSDYAFTYRGISVFYDDDL